MLDKIVHIIEYLNNVLTVISQYGVYTINDFDDEKDLVQVLLEVVSTMELSQDNKKITKVKND